MPSHSSGTPVPCSLHTPSHHRPKGFAQGLARGLPLALAAGLLGAAPALWAQAPMAPPTPPTTPPTTPATTPPTTSPSLKPPPQNPSWPKANEAVGQFQRGHIDLLRWEQQNTPPPAPERAVPTGLSALSSEAALAMALHGQPLFLWRAGMSGPEQVELHTRLQNRVLQVRRAWTAAVADTQSASYNRQVLSAAEAGAELAERMARIGSFSRARQMQEELLLWDARARLHSAELQALQSVQNLWRLIGQGQSAQALAEALPSLPELPTPPQAALDGLDGLEQQALAAHPKWPTAQTEATRLLQAQTPSSLAALRQSMAQAAPATRGDAVSASRLDNNVPWSHSAEKALQTQLETDALQRQIRADVRVAHAAYQSARQQAAHSRNDVQRLYTALEEESVLRYNGMLKSTWDLLASARQRIQSVDAAHQAQRQAWLAWADLQAVLNGLPYTGSLGAARYASTPSTAGH